MKHQFVFLVALASRKGHRCIHCHWWYVLTWIIHKPYCVCFVLWCFLKSTCEWLCSSSSFCSLKTSLTKWKPDFDSAASEYAKAGELKSGIFPSRMNVVPFITADQLCLSPFSCVLQEREAVRTSQGCLPERSWISHRKQDVSYMWSV